MVKWNVVFLMKIYIKLLLTALFWGGTFVAGRIVSQNVRAFFFDFRFSLYYHILNLKNYEFCKMEVRHTLKRKKSLFVFFFSNSKSLCNKQLGDYLRKSKKQIFLNKTPASKVGILRFYPQY